MIQENHRANTLQDAGNDAAVDLHSAASIHDDIACILQELIVKYLGSDNTSIRETTAMEILSSIYFTIETAITWHGGTAGTELQGKDIKNLYEEGMEWIRARVAQSKELYGRISENKLPIPLDTYQDTIDIALPAFFQAYDIQFAAHEIPCSMDYPLANDDMTKKGIHYIHAYLQKLALETAYYRCFNMKDIRKLLRGYGRMYHLNVREVPVSLFELLFDQAVICILCGVEPALLAVYGQSIIGLNARMAGMDEKEISHMIHLALKSMIEKLGIRNTQLVKYMKRYSLSFGSRFSRALAFGSLANMAVVENKKHSTGSIFKDGKRMSDLSFTRLIDRIQECPDTTGKVKLINARINSLEDYIDLLASDCLYESEYTALYQTLSDMEIAIIGSRIMDDAPGEHQLQAPLEKLMEHREEMEWQGYFIGYLADMDAERKQSIAAILNDIKACKEDNSMDEPDLTIE